MTATPEEPQTAPSAPESAETPAARPETPDAPRYALYARSGGPTPEGAERQIQELRRKLDATDGVQVVAWYADHQTPRPQVAFRELLDDARAGRFDRVLVADRQVLGRGLTDHATALEDLAATGVDVETLDGERLTGATGMAMVRIMAAFAEHEERTLAAYEAHYAGPLDEARQLLAAAYQSTDQPRAALYLRPCDPSAVLGNTERLAVRAQELGWRPVDVYLELDWDQTAAFVRLLAAADAGAFTHVVVDTDGLDDDEQAEGAECLEDLAAHNLVVHVTGEGLTLSPGMAGATAQVMRAFQQFEAEADKENLRMRETLQGPRSESSEQREEDTTKGGA